jgi:hypothetical protein
MRSKPDATSYITTQEDVTTGSDAITGRDDNIESITAYIIKISL